MRKISDTTLKDRLVGSQPDIEIAKFGRFLKKGDVSGVEHVVATGYKYFFSHAEISLEELFYKGIAFLDFFMKADSFAIFQQIFPAANNNRFGKMFVVNLKCLLLELG